MPGSASGVLFMTIEDETANANLIVWPKIFERQRRLILSSPMIGAKGRVQREGEVIHLIAREFFDFSGLLRTVGDRDERSLLLLDPGAPNAAMEPRRSQTIKIAARDFR
jgi:error-prone DNA polymerase